MIRVVVVEDSLTVRQLLVKILNDDPEIEVVGEATNGAEGVDLAARLKPDLVTMDIHMPVMDGLEATKEIMAATPTPIIVVSSSTSQEDARLSFDAMQAGALMVMAKPENPQSGLFNGRRDQFLAMARAMSQVKVVRRWPQRPTPPPPRPRSRGPAAPVRMIAIAASTGGPAALQRILAELPGDLPIPILVVQHIALGFVGGLADWLSSRCNLNVKVAEAGENLLQRNVYLAPDDRHLGVSRNARVILADALPIKGFRPSATYLFESVARAYGAGVAAVILTGMGSDGVDGLKGVKAAGGQVLAQDEATSVVYGMPGEAVATGVVDAVVSVDAIGRRLVELVAGEE